MSKLGKIVTPALRQYLYLLTTSVLALLVGMRVIDAEVVPLWLTVVGTALGLGSSTVAAVAVAAQRKDGTLP